MSWARKILFERFCICRCTSWTLYYPVPLWDQASPVFWVCIEGTENVINLHPIDAFIHPKSWTRFTEFHGIEGSILHAESYCFAFLLRELQGVRLVPMRMKITIVLRCITFSLVLFLSHINMFSQSSTVWYGLDLESRSIARLTPRSGHNAL